MNVLVNTLHTTTTPTTAPRSNAEPLARGLGQSVLLAMQHWGRRRAVRELRRLACCYQGANPDLARQFRAAARYNEVLH